METSTELSSSGLISLKEKSESNIKIPGLDDIKVHLLNTETNNLVKDRNGNILKSGMTGWCYGGYLE